MEVWSGKSHVHPELPSGMRSSPDAGMMLIQQPGRDGDSLRNRLSASAPGPRSSTVGLFARKKTHEPEPDIVPQLCPGRLMAHSPVPPSGLIRWPLLRL